MLEEIYSNCVECVGIFGISRAGDATKWQPKGVSQNGYCRILGSIAKCLEVTNQAPSYDGSRYFWMYAPHKADSYWFVYTSYFVEAEESWVSEIRCFMEKQMGNIVYFQGSTCIASDAESHFTLLQSLENIFYKNHRSARWTSCWLHLNEIQCLMNNSPATLLQGTLKSHHLQFLVGQVFNLRVVYVGSRSWSVEISYS